MKPVQTFPIIAAIAIAHILLIGTNSELAAESIQEQIKQGSIFKPDQLDVCDINPELCPRPPGE